MAESIHSIVREVFWKFDFRNESGLLQFWVCSTDPNSEDMGCNLMLTEITWNPTQNLGLEDFRKRCLEKLYPFVGRAASVGNWFAGRAAQTGIADHRTAHHVLDQEDQHSADVGGKGQLVLPVYYGRGEPAGIIEFVTPVPKECYVEDFAQIHNLLKEAGLKSTFMGKIIKVVYNGTIIKFALPLSAEFRDLYREVTKRHTELQHQIFRVEYNNTVGNLLSISSDDDVRVCLDESSSRGAKFIRMFVFVEQRGKDTKGLIRKSYSIVDSELLQA